MTTTTDKIQKRIERNTDEELNLLSEEIMRSIDAVGKKYDIKMDKDNHNLKFRDNDAKFGGKNYNEFRWFILEHIKNAMKERIVEKKVERLIEKMEEL